MYDVGAFDGADTAYYLHRGYRVLSIEADPTLATRLREKFAKEIARGHCVVLNVGVAEREGEATFFVNDRVPVWSSFNRVMAAREADAVREILVPCRTFASIMRDFGVPFYLKVDIEGLDHLCVYALQPTDLPRYVSFEAGADAPTLVLRLGQLGYDRFRLVNQQSWAVVSIPRAGRLYHTAWSLRQWGRLRLRRLTALHRALGRAREWVTRRGADRGRTRDPVTVEGRDTWYFEPGCSGPLPFDGVFPWLSLPKFMHTWVSADESGILESSWFDVHAALPGLPS